jgi:hypothetical protein
MQPTEAISASDCPFRGSGRQHFSKKTHPDFRERPFYPLISDLASCTCPEKTTFSNDTAADIGKDGLEEGQNGKNPCFGNRDSVSFRGSLLRRDAGTGAVGNDLGARFQGIFFMARAGPGNIPARASPAKKIFCTNLGSVRICHKKHDNQNNKIFINPTSPKLYYEKTKLCNRFHHISNIGIYWPHSFLVGFDEISEYCDYITSIYDNLYGFIINCNFYYEQ